MELFKTNFTGATNPALTPTPWDSVTEAANNDLLYGATHGLGSGPGMRVQWNAGTAGIACKGKVDFLGQPRGGLPMRLAGRHTRFSFWSVFTTMAANVAVNDEITLLRAYQISGGVETEIFSVVWIKTAATTAKWKLTQTIGVATSATQTSTALANIDTAGRTYQLDVICNGIDGTQFLSFGEAETGVGLVQLRLGGQVPGMSSFEMGGIAATPAAPTSTTEFRFDNVLVINDDWNKPFLVPSSGTGIQLLGHQSMEVGRLILAVGQCGVFGAMGTADLAAEVSAAIVPSPQIGIAPGGLYEVIGRQIAASPAFPGITLFVPCSGVASEILPGSSIGAPMVGVGSWQFKAQQDQDALIIINLEGVAMDYFIRRLR